MPYCRKRFCKTPLLPPWKSSAYSSCLPSLPVSSPEELQPCHGPAQFMCLASQRLGRQVLGFTRLPEANTSPAAFFDCSYFYFERLHTTVSVACMYFICWIVRRHFSRKMKIMIFFLFPRCVSNVSSYLDIWSSCTAKEQAPTATVNCILPEFKTLVLNFGEYHSCDVWSELQIRAQFTVRPHWRPFPWNTS